LSHKGASVAQNGSDGVMNYIASAAANGAIGYDEYSYALNKNFPVAKMENKAGYFTLPNQYNVAKSLTQAVIDNDPNSPTYLIQKLDNVYVYNDPRTYPLSSYTYMILPVGTNSQDSRLTTPKRQTLTDFLYYGICTGQREMGPIGYSPLPVNLVQAGFDQIQKLKTADSGVDITRRDVSTCNNPTFDPSNPNSNKLAAIAPLPPACDKVGAGPCTDGGVASGPGGSGSGGGGGNGSGGNASASANPSASASGGVRVDPNTGEVIGAGGGNGGSGNGNVDSDLAAARTNAMTGVLAPLAIAELLGLLVLPIVVHHRLARRRGSRP
jgi:hypothetical protein